MRYERCTNPDCMRPFQVNEFEFAARHAPDDTQTAGFICPHCGERQHVFSNSVILVHALSEEEEEEFNRSHPVHAGKRP